MVNQESVFATNSYKIPYPVRNYNFDLHGVSANQRSDLLMNIYMKIDDTFSPSQKFPQKSIELRNSYEDFQNQDTYEGVMSGLRQEQMLKMNRLKK